MPSDTNTAQYAPTLPPQVREAAARAEEMAREAGLAATEEQSNGEDTTVVNQPTNGAGEGDQLVLPEIEPPPTQPPVQSDWEQRYNTLQGKYNAEIPELRGQLRAMQDMVNNLQTRGNQPEQPRAREQTFQPMPTRSVPEEDVESFGQDLVVASRRWSRIEVEPDIAELRQRMSQLEGATQQTANMTTAQRCETNMDRMMPDWRAVNVDRGFIDWLQLIDPFSGRTRQSLINEAYGAGDAPRTVAFFQAYANEHTTVSQTPGIQQVQTGNSTDRLPLADLAVPGRGQAAAPPTPGAPTRRTWTGADIAAFYRQKQRGMYLGREQEAAAIEADFTAAGREGRVRQ
jgi:hypothetical protein